MADQIKKKLVINNEDDASQAIAEIRAMCKEVNSTTPLMAKVEKGAEAWLKEGTEENAKSAIAAVKKYDQAVAATEKANVKEAAEKLPKSKSKRW